MQEVLLVLRVVSRPGHTIRHERGSALVQVATKAGLKTAWSDKALNYRFVAGPGDPLNLADRITESYNPAIDYVIDKK